VSLCGSEHKLGTLEHPHLRRANWFSRAYETPASTNELQGRTTGTGIVETSAFPALGWWARLRL